ncbi:class I SAM-dependent methyltransferase [Streptomyces hoynatensis]|uniref:Class I SAM-dependent methyltransferase n=1 Tax=Streptomyces hoynatensis TaxID=1141874 RepID=A0A3A9YQY3_9ACTN|nr:class I SAM-dependent methyltransferase [Streptomyces hoynatensis]RKN37777.1 class I SAM-dependent methyltransferase [Streptomyces hoynatensis]
MEQQTGAWAVVAAYWDAAADAFDEEPDHGLRDGRVRRAWARRLAQWIPVAAADVLDVGCGTGSLSLLLGRAGHRVLGVDLSPRMVEAARAKAARAAVAASFLVGDAAAPPTGSRRFDVVLARHLLWTLPDPAAALSAWVGRLRPGGRLVLVEGRWGAAEGSAAPYGGAVGAALPWGSGVGAAELAGVVASLPGEPRDVRTWSLTQDAEDFALWGGEVSDERFVLTARFASPPGASGAC